MAARGHLNWRYYTTARRRCQWLLVVSDRKLTFMKNLLSYSAHRATLATGLNLDVPVDVRFAQAVACHQLAFGPLEEFALNSPLVKCNKCAPGALDVIMD
jgi:hypothetical protein